MFIAHGQDPFGMKIQECEEKYIVQYRQKQTG